MKRHTKSLIDLIGQLHPLPVVGAEIGVWTGHNAAALLLAFPELVLYGVDDYRGCPNGKITGEEACTMARCLLGEFDYHYKPVLSESKKAAITFGYEIFDFIFIDASHDYESVKADIALWEFTCFPFGTREQVEDQLFALYEAPREWPDA